MDYETLRRRWEARPERLAPFLDSLWDDPAFHRAIGPAIPLYAHYVCNASYANGQVLTEGRPGVILHHELLWFGVEDSTYYRWLRILRGHNSLQLPLVKWHRYWEPGVFFVQCLWWERVHQARAHLRDVRRERRR